MKSLISRQWGVRFQKKDDGKGGLPLLSGRRRALRLLRLLLRLGQKALQPLQGLLGCLLHPCGRLLNKGQGPLLLSLPCMLCMRQPQLHGSRRSRRGRAAACRGLLLTWLPLLLVPPQLGRLRRLCRGCRRSGMRSCQGGCAVAAVAPKL